MDGLMHIAWVQHNDPVSKVWTRRINRFVELPPLLHHVVTSLRRCPVPNAPPPPILHQTPPLTPTPIPHQTSPLTPTLL
eukprot:139219-Chlamydomonas_euryale.AAC.4